jgi:hypothetical protein
MARTPAAVNGGWPSRPAEPDPRSARAPQGQRPAQAGYPQQGSYPEQQAPNPGYDPQSAYHYPQGGQPAPAQQQPAPEYAPYPAAPYGQPQQPQQPRGYGQPAPYGAPGRQPDPMPDPRSAAGYDQWQMGAPQQDPRGGYDLGTYMPTGAPQQPEWGAPASLGYAEGGALRDAYGGGQMGYEPTHAGALEQSYAQEEAGDYDVDEPRRRSWMFRILGAIVVAIGLGYGLAQGYKLVADTSPDGVPPVVRSESAPAKTTPADPGGKEFAHADSKIMGRLGEGSPGAEASAESDVDASGARKVQTLVVGRDGSISPPAADQPVTTGAVAVPGVTIVDGFGGGYPQSTQSAAAAVPEESSQPPPAAVRKPLVVKPPASETKPVAVANVTPSATDEGPAAPEEPAPTKTAAVAPPSSGGANGYVVVLASVPASNESRLAALRKFADMQQKYGTVLQSKTPDVQEANLGAKGTYHRLLVGPPGSRAQASTLCSDLKAAGYKDCWVMAY